MERSRFEDVFSDDDAITYAKMLSELIQSPGWRVYKEILKGARIQARERAFEGEDSDFKQAKGYVEGLEMAERWPSVLIEQARLALAAEEKRQPKDKLARRPLTLEAVEQPESELGDPSF